MNSAHDVGGMHGFGPVVRQHDEPLFEADWERRTLVVLVNALGRGRATADANRHAMERMGNARYLTTSYYEHWLVAMETMLVENGVLGAQEIAGRVEALRRDPAAFPAPARSAGDDLAARSFRELLHTGGSSLRATGRAPRFAVGDAVAARNIHPRGHIRLPRYARGRRGRIAACHGCHLFPDTNADGRGECPEPLYQVEFAAQELWGGEAWGTVHLDLWESYLEERSA